MPGDRGTKFAHCWSDLSVVSCNPAWLGLPIPARDRPRLEITAMKIRKKDMPNSREKTMKNRNSFSAALLLFAAATAMFVGTVPLESIVAQDASSQTDKTELPGQRAETSDNEHADDDSPALGVLVGSCPGEGVCVTDTIWGSPAEQAGIQPGDYILAVNDQTVSTPKELKKVIGNLAKRDTVNVSVWRQGQTMNKEVTLASEAKTLPESRRAWLAVMLTEIDDDGKGVMIQSVNPRSPAMQAGLKSGDIVTKLNDETVDSIDLFVDRVGDLEPSDELKMTIKRNGVEQTLKVVLGRVGDAPIQWFRRSMRSPLGDRGFDLPRLQPLIGNSMPGDPMLDEIIDDMREQIRLLRMEVDELKEQSSPDESVPGQSDPGQSDPGERVKVEELDPDDFSSVLDPRIETIELVQFTPDRDRNRRSFGGNSPRNLPHLSNDWTGERYRYQDRRPDRYRSNRYPSYRYPSYRYPYPSYPYRYYEYGGRPYYYGGGYPYGYRGGVQIGNFGIWW